MRKTVSWSVLGAILFVALIAGILTIAFVHDIRWEHQCKKDGYKVVNVYKGTLCTTQDGRIVRSL